MRSNISCGIRLRRRGYSGRPNNRGGVMIPKLGSIIAKAEEKKSHPIEAELEGMTYETWPLPQPEGGIVPSSLFGFEKLVFLNLKGYYCCI
jgi:hypothetical protein